MALLTYAQGAEYWSRLNIHPTFGPLYFDHSPIFRLFQPNVVPAGRLQVNLTDGATAASVAATAGIPGTGAPAKVDDNETKVFGMIHSQAQLDLPTIAQGGGFEANLSMERAMGAIYREAVGQLVGTNNGETLGQLWGVGDYLTVTQESDSMTVSGSYACTGASAANLRKSMGKLLSKLPQDGSPNICVTSPEGYEAVYNAIEEFGGITPPMTAQDTFGFSNLVYRNTVFFASDKVNSGTDTVASGDIAYSDYYLLNLGAEGVKLCFPDSLDIFTVKQGRTVGQAADVWDIWLTCQFLYTGHHSAGKLTEWIEAV